MPSSLPLAPALPVSAGPHRRVAQVLLLSPVFGLAMALSFTAGWIGLGRVFTERTLAAATHISVAAAISAALTLIGCRALRHRRWSARFALSVLLLSAGTCAVASL